MSCPYQPQGRVKTIPEQYRKALEKLLTFRSKAYIAEKIGRSIAWINRKLKA